MTVEIIPLSVSMKVWDRTMIKLTTPGSEVGTDYTTGPGCILMSTYYKYKYYRYKYFRFSHYARAGNGQN